MGLFNSVYRFYTQCYPPKSKFDPDRDIPDLSGKVVIVTGGNTGIGKETVRALLVKNAKVYMASRSRERAESAIRDLKELTGKEAIFLELDLASLDKVTKAANEFKSKEKALHILFNSGGVMTPPIGMLTEDGYDLQFGTNTLGHAHFTLSLLPELLEGAKTSSDGKARVVNTASAVVYLNSQPLIKWDTLRGSPARTKYGTNGLYNQSKFANIAFSNELARRYGDQGIYSNAVNPGNLDSELQRHISKIQQILVRLIFSHPVHLGALTQLYVATSPEAANTNGGWFVPWARPYIHSPETRNPEVEAQLWDYIQEQRKNH